jgi:hypothetical protein
LSVFLSMACIFLFLWRSSHFCCTLNIMNYIGRDSRFYYVPLKNAAVFLSTQLTW